ncbi:MAG: protein kinase [Deltaproteobacteria bacterium]|nr:protein kinase [Deltaproteobacteria bacterium]
MDGTPLNIVHRDLDPNNILLSREGEVKITDFGLVRSDVQEHLTQTGVIKGKLHYMPPEAILGEKFDHRSDIFALGVVLYEAVTGVKPFADTVQFRIMDKIRHGEYDPPEKIAPRLPRRFATSSSAPWRTSATIVFRTRGR